MRTASESKPPDVRRESQKMKAKAKRKSKGTSGASQSGKSPSKSKRSPKTAAKSEPAAPEAGDWRGETLSRMRALILQADPEMIEERKWRKPSNGMAGVPVWSHDGMVCTGESYKEVVKLTFVHGAKLPDPARLFNSSLEGATRRAIDIREGETVRAAAFKKLVQAAVALNASRKKR
jgi:hypothetical protein